MNEVVRTDTAIGHIEAIQRYIAKFNPAAATHVAESPRDAGGSLANFPHRGSPVNGTTMRELVTVYPYIIRYRVTGSRVVILRVRHTARRPTSP